MQDRVQTDDTSVEGRAAAGDRRFVRKASDLTDEWLAEQSRRALRHLWGGGPSRGGGTLTWGELWGDLRKWRAR